MRVGKSFRGKRADCPGREAPSRRVSGTKSAPTEREFPGNSFRPRKNANAAPNKRRVWRREDASIESGGEWEWEGREKDGRWGNNDGEERARREDDADGEMTAEEKAKD